jgi:hypothetical protein
MTPWEYGHIYVVHTVGPSPAVCVAVDGQEPWVMQGCHGLLQAANVLGGTGWIVSGQGEKIACAPWVDDLVRPIEGAIHGDSVMRYFMRRPRDSSIVAD